MLVPTVRIVAPTDEGYAVINEADFDPSQHVRFVDAAETEQTPDESVESATEPDTVDSMLDKIAEKRKPRRVRKPTSE